MKEQTVQDVFGLSGETAFDEAAADIAETKAWDKVVVVAMPPRSGSTALVSALANAGLASEIWEILNPRGPIPALLEASGAESFEDYLRFYFREMMKTESFIFKTAFQDFEFFTTPPRRKVFSPASYVFVHRNDRLAQAYSLAKARRSGVWHRAVGKKGDTSEIVPTLDEVRRDLVNVNREVDNWRQFFDQYQIEPYSVVYEDMCADPAAVVGDLFRFITGRPPENQVSFGYEIVRTRADEAVLERYRKELQ
jgi:LPS sulfotransferase NodH